VHQLLDELRRRNVFRVGVAYVVIAWALAQVAELALDSFDAPSWVMKSLLLLLALGLPLALFFAWAFELTPEGLKREKDVDRSQSITHETGRRLNSLIIVVLLIAVGMLLVDKFVLRPGTAPPEAASASLDEQANRVIEKSIAVMPFVDMSAAKDQEYFTDGLTENLLHALAQVGEIKVTGRTSSFAFKGRNEDLRSIGEQLNVRNILEGSVQKSGNRIRVTAQLIDTDDGFHLWSETFDRNLDDIFAVQDEIAAAVVKALRQSLLGEPEIQAAYDGNVDAYNAYLRGQYYHSKANIDDWPQAIAHFRRAVEIDPDMALAWAGLAAAIAEYTGFSSDFSTGYEQAREAALKALALDPGLPEAHLAMAEIQISYDWDWAAAERSLTRALESRPADPDIRAYLASLLLILGEPLKALEQLDLALARDPLNTALQNTRGWALLRLGRVDEALRVANQLRASHPERGALGVMVSAARTRRGELDLAMAAAKDERLPFLRLTAMAVVYVELGNTEKAEELLQQLISEHGDDASYQVAAIYANMGDKDGAFEALERGFAIRDPGVKSVQIHADFDVLHDDPRYDAFLEKLGLR